MARSTVYGFGLERLGLVCLRWPKVSALLFAVISAVMAAGVLRVEFDDDLQNLLRTDSAPFHVYDRFLAAFPDTQNQLYLLVEGEGLETAAGLEAVRTLHLELQFVDGVNSVSSIFSARRLPDAEGRLAPVFPSELPSGAALDALVEEAHTHPLLAGKMLAADRSATLVIVTLHRGIGEFAAIGAVLREIASAADYALDGRALTYVATGPPALRYEVLVTIRSDLHVLNLAGAAMSVLVCALFFRRPTWVLLASAAPLLGVVWVMGGFALAGQKFTAMSNILPTLVLVIGFSNALHMVNAIRRRVAEGEGALEATDGSVREIGPACAMTSVTTMIALLSLTLSDSALVREFGVTGAIAVFAAFVAVIAIIPTMAALMVPLMRVRPPRREPAMMHLALGASERCWSVVARFPVWVIGVAVAVLAVTGYGFFQLEPRYDYREYLSRDSAANQAIDRINAKLGGADAIFVLVERLEHGPDVRAPGNVVASVQQALEGTGVVNNLLSIASVEAWLDSGVHHSLTVEQALERMPDRASGRFASDSGEAWLISGYAPAAPAPETATRIEAMERALAPVREAVEGYAIDITGIVPLSATQSGILIDGLKDSLTFAILVIMLLIGVTSRSLKLALFAAVPNLLSLTVVASALTLFGAGFQFTSAIALTVAFGIAVDNTVHFVHRFRLERRGAGVAEALAETMRKVGPVLFAATAVLALGLAVTQISALPMVVLFGRLCIVILCTALLATLLVLSALILATSLRGRRG